MIRKLKILLSVADLLDTVKSVPISAVSLNQFFIKGSYFR
tara:strand:- start:886 stop:1005 length:120 start_codon:yes stop_codon:yes gene_type:complete